MLRYTCIAYFVWDNEVADVFEPSSSVRTEFETAVTAHIILA